MRGPTGACTCAVLKVTNIREVEKGLDAWLAAAEAKITNVTRGLGAVLFKTIVKESPQYSGDFAANWKYSLNSIDHSFTKDLFDGAVSRTEVIRQDLRNSNYLFTRKYPVGGFIKGSPAAVDYAMAVNKGKDAAFKLGDTIHMSNSAAHDESYAMLIEDNKIKFRQGNNGAPARLGAMHFMNAHRTITKARAEGLARTKL